MNIIISNSSGLPIYAQIAEQIKNQIINGTLQGGDALPSIRGLAKELQISVITTKRAYEELEKESFIETVSGKGTFVAMQSSELLKEKRMKILEQKMVEVIKEAKAIEVTLEEVVNMVEILYEDD